MPEDVDVDDLLEVVGGHGLERAGGGRGADGQEGLPGLLGGGSGGLGLGVLEEDDVVFAGVVGGDVGVIEGLGEEGVALVGAGGDPALGGGAAGEEEG